MTNEVIELDVYENDYCYFFCLKLEESYKLKEGSVGLVRLKITMMLYFFKLKPPRFT